MSCNWPLVKLADVACIITTKIDANQITKDCYISTENMQPYKGGVSSADSLPSAAKFNSFRVGDTLFSNIRTYFEKVWLASFSGGASADVLIFRTKDESVLLSEYLYHFLSSPEFIEFTVRTSKGAKMPRGDKGAMMDFEFKLPPVEIQKIIACSLQGLERKVRLNSQTNQTLEQMAQAIFKSWFVDFDPVKAKINGEQPEGMDAATASLFPEKLVESELGLIPEGWEVSTLSSLIQLTGGGTPKRSEETYWNGDIPWFSVRDVPSGSNVFVVDTDEKITELGLNKSSTKLLPKGTTIITARGTVGKLALVGTDMCMNQSCYGIRGKEVGDFYNYFNLNEAVSTLQRNTHGAVFDTITTKTFDTYSMPFGGVELANKFDSIVAPLLQKIEANVRQNIELSTLRDTLLPKLLSGEIELAEKQEN
ncbi:restriction endonuclease subunit S [Shewanella inventionis]|uniref:Type I restriction modification DNA specificity domain-containing protein n=1 Tax=Shewanella inventionis TaxID=1738770 RepID=A0ABQ1JTU5_9GAMM|nr:restriction endonuclease subunit S [Shewanella inventionis]MCL1159916.1 restriction endonuclease subunit S [Shewanella inventionis]GGB74811.1 hypothetical protein GCM10011607_38990 [Shewanella inventionis]